MKQMYPSSWCQNLADNYNNCYKCSNLYLPSGVCPKAKMNSKIILRLDNPIVGDSVSIQIIVWDKTLWNKARE